MKRIIVFFVLVFCIFSFVEAQYAKTKIPINFGFGLSARLHPSLDANLLLGPVELYSFYETNPELNALGVGLQIYLFKFGDDDFQFILSADQTLMDSDYENEYDDQGNVEHYTSKRSTLCIGIKQFIFNYGKGSFTGYMMDRSSWSFKIGVSNTRDLKDELQPHMEFNYCFYFGKQYKKFSILGHN